MLNLFLNFDCTFNSSCPFLLILSSINFLIMTLAVVGQWYILDRSVKVQHLVFYKYLACLVKYCITLRFEDKSMVLFLFNS